MQENYIMMDQRLKPEVRGHKEVGYRKIVKK